MPQSLPTSASADGGPRTRALRQPTARPGCHTDRPDAAAAPPPVHADSMSMGAPTRQDTWLFQPAKSHNRNAPMTSTAWVWYMAPAQRTKESKIGGRSLHTAPTAHLPHPFFRRRKQVHRKRHCSLARTSKGNASRVKCPSSQILDRTRSLHAQASRADTLGYKLSSICKGRPAAPSLLSQAATRKTSTHALLSVQRPSPMYPLSIHHHPNHYNKTNRKHYSHDTR